MNNAEARCRASAIIAAAKQRGADFEKLASDESLFYRDIFLAILEDVQDLSKVEYLAKQALRVNKSEHQRWG